MMDGMVDKLAEWGMLYGARIIGAIAILVLGRIAVSFINGSIKKLMRRSKADETLVKFVSSLTRIGLMIFVALAALSTLGVQTTSFIAVVGAAGLAIGLAMQNSLSNFSAGIMLVIFRPFKAGDFVEAGGTSGVVEAVRIFNTNLKTPDNKIVIIPNSKITGDNIVNYSAQDTRRIDLVFGIGYDSDLKKAKQILQRILGEDARILKDPAPVVAVSELADSSVNFVVRPWVKTPEYWTVRFDIIEKVKLTFDNEGISIPFPQRDIHLHQAA